MIVDTCYIVCCAAPRVDGVVTHGDTTEQKMMNLCARLSAAAALSIAATSTLADIPGINGLDGWRYNQTDGGTPADLPDPDTIRITNLGTSQARSIFYTTRQAYSQFVASFTYQALNAGQFCDYGTTFTIQSDPFEANAIGSTGGNLAYAGNPGVRNSMAFTLQLGTNTSGYWTGGNTGNSNSIEGINLRSGHPIDVTLSYNGTILSIHLIDTVTNQEYTANLIVGDLEDVIGAPTAFVGFTASTTTGQCAGSAADQYISDFLYIVECDADANMDGQLNILDFVAFQQAFVAGDESADCDGDGNLDVLDFVCFQQLFKAGC